MFAALDDPVLKQQLQNPTVGNYINIPIPAYVGITSRFLNVEENTLLPVIQSQIFTDLQTFVQAKKGLTYVHGPQGFGKSFAAYHLFCVLSTYPNNRVLYIPDCHMINDDSFLKLFKAVAAAFALDEEFLNKIYPLALSFTDNSWDDLMDHLKRHCVTDNLTFFAIFDQHNGLKKRQCRRAPTNLLQWPKALNGPFFKLIISASANNDDQTVTKDTKSTGFGEREKRLEDAPVLSPARERVLLHAAGNFHLTSLSVVQHSPPSAPRANIQRYP